jgi:quercetin dioxygenase-like cupin family protein
MKLNRIATIGIVTFLMVVVAFCVPVAHAASQGLTIKVLQKATVSGDDTKEAVLASGEFAVGGTTGRHTHPGDEYTFVVEGTLELQVDGGETRRVNAGDTYFNPRGVIHSATNVGDKPAKVLVTFIAEKGKKITEPAQ